MIYFHVSLWAWGTTRYLWSICEISRPRNESLKMKTYHGQIRLQILQEMLPHLLPIVVYCLTYCWCSSKKKGLFSSSCRVGLASFSSSSGMCKRRSCIPDGGVQVKTWPFDDCTFLRNRTEVDFVGNSVCGMILRRSLYKLFDFIQLISFYSYILKDHSSEKHLGWSDFTTIWVYFWFSSVSGLNLDLTISWWSLDARNTDILIV